MSALDGKVDVRFDRGDAERLAALFGEESTIEGALRDGLSGTHLDWEAEARRVAKEAYDLLPPGAAAMFDPDYLWPDSVPPGQPGDALGTHP